MHGLRNATKTVRYLSKKRNTDDLEVTERRAIHHKELDEKALSTPIEARVTKTTLRSLFNLFC